MGGRTRAMADNGGMGVEGDNVLFRELQTTAVYDSLQRQPPERHILTLSRTEAVYQILTEATAAADASAILQSAPEIVVQVRKRFGAVQLLIDGFVSEGVPDANDARVRVHNLDFHKGLHEDMETSTRVFSPLAIVAAIEDGQHPLQNVKVGVVQHFYHDGGVVGDATLLGEVNLAPHSVSDVRCSAARAPYPLVFAKPFTVTISDTTTRDKFKNVGVIKSLLNIARGTGAVVGSLFMLSPPLAFTAPGAAGLIGIGSATALALSLATMARSFGQNYLAILLRNITSSKMPSAIDSSLEQNRKAMLAVYQTTKEYLTARPEPQEKDVVFTLDEFAKTLESLAVLKALGPNDEIDDPETLSKGHDFRREKVVWHWLVTEDAGNISAAGLELDKSVTTGLRVRISIDDPMACAPASQHHDIYCSRDDGHYLGAAASGAMHDLMRIRKAIYGLTAMLDSAIHDKNRAQTWPDKYLFAPALYTAQVIAGRWKKQESNLGLLRRVSTYTAHKWNDLQGPNGKDARVEWFKQAKELLLPKLLEPFFGNVGAVGALAAKLTAALNDPRAPLATPQTLWVRRLPQRVTAQVGTRLFTRSADFALEYTDVFTDAAVVREFSSHSKLVQAVSATMKSSRTAIQRFAREWEAGRDTHIALVCMCKDARIPPTGGFEEPPRWSALTLSTPVDVQFSASIVSIPERTRRRLRLVARRAQQRCDKSVLEALGLAHTNADLLACQVFGDLWVAELLAMHAAPNSRQVQMLEQASRRAAERLRAAGDLLLRLVAGGNPSTNASERADVAPTSADIALVATQAGRDAGQLLDRVLFSQDYAIVRAAMVPLIRNCAHTAVRAAGAFTKNVPVYLPHGPTASLFGDRYDGVAAFLRAKSMTDDDALVRTITAAYPSALLLDESYAFDAAQVATLRARAPTNRPVATPQERLVAAMRFRLASLQMEPTADDVENLSVDELAEELAATKLGVSSAHRSFYVPFGFGDARPAPTFPPCAAPMFGTVPVFCDALTRSFGSVLDCLQGKPRANQPTNALCIRLEPTLDCLRDPNESAEVEAAHPNTLHVVRTKAGKRTCVTVTYAASRAPRAGAVAAPPVAAAAAVATTLLAAEVKRAVEEHAGNEGVVGMAARVSSLAWNAERVVQAVVAALASADTEEVFDAVELTLELPPDGDERSYWYSVPPDPFRVQQRQYVDVNEAKRLCGYLNHLSKQHLDVLGEIFLEIQQFGVDDQAQRSGVSLAMPDDKHWVEVAQLRDGLLDTTAPGDALTVRAKLAAAPVLKKHDAWAKLAGELLGLIAKAQRELQAFLNKRPVVSQDPDVVKAKRVLQIPEPSPVRAPTDEASRRALIGSLGVGMAMLVPLLHELDLSCASVVLRKGDSGCEDAVLRTMRAFGRCEAVRLSEACLVVSQHVSA